MKISEVLEECARNLSKVHGMSMKDAYGQLAIACMRRGGFTVAYVNGKGELVLN